MIDLFIKHTIDVTFYFFLSHLLLPKNALTLNVSFSPLCDLKQETCLQEQIV